MGLPALIDTAIAGGIAIIGISLITFRFGMVGLVGSILGLLALGALFS